MSISKKVEKLEFENEYLKSVISAYQVVNEYNFVYSGIYLPLKHAKTLIDALEIIKDYEKGLKK